MTVSKIASEIYQTAKTVCNGVWNWRSEWSKAMKQAWKLINGENEMEYGSEKQVKWARSLKENININVDTKNPVVKAAVERVMSITDAGWWCDNEPYKMLTLLTEAAKYGLKLEDGRVMRLTATEMKIV